ncbi:TlpA family protein disulfide reductase [Pelagibacteraceae bacterium]|nr:TlpA family protein disulfide reductase [Pelagibacteraceae bacterium]
MKISKSFKIYIHIFAAFFFAQQLLSETNYSKNIVLHKEPLEIKELKFKDFNLNAVDLTGKKGNIMILNFWATWCVPCKKEMPSLEKLSKEYPEILIYPVNLEKPNQEKTQKFFTDLEISKLNIYFDPNFSLVKLFKMRGVPTSILIDKNGKEFGRVIGEIDFFDESFVSLLKKYL